MTERTRSSRMLRVPGARVCVAAAAGVLSALAVAGCGAGPHGRLEGRASSDWSRSYTIAPGGELQIVGAAGSIDVRQSEGSAVEVRAERVIHAANDAIAAPMVERIRIAEEVAPDKVLLRNEGLGGIIIGVEIEVNFHVTVPAGLKLRLHAAGGDISLADLTGPVVVTTTNGSITGTGLRGGVNARTTNGNLVLAVAAVGEDAVDVRATNGSIELTLPAASNVNVAANVTNGTIDAGDLPLEQTGERARRRLRGRLNDGGTPVELNTTNGNIQIRAVP